MRNRFIMIVPFLALTACSEQQVLVYEGRPAATAQECEAAYEAAKQRMRSTVIVGNSGASLAGAVIGKSMARGMTESHYNACLTRVQNLPAGSVPVVAPAMTRRPAAVAPAAATHTGGCLQGGGAMQGGTGYCIGS